MVITDFSNGFIMLIIATASNAYFLLLFVLFTKP